MDCRHVYPASGRFLIVKRSANAGWERNSDSSQQHRSQQHTHKYIVQPGTEQPSYYAGEGKVDDAK